MLEEYLNSFKAEVFIGKSRNYLRNTRCADNKRAVLGKAPLGPAFYKEPGKPNSTKTVFYKKQDLVNWMIVRKANKELDRLVKGRYGDTV